MLRSALWNFLLLASLLLAACQPLAVPAAPTALPTPTPDVSQGKPGSSAGEVPTTDPNLPSYAPQAGDAAFDRGPVFIDEVDMLSAESFPPQISIIIRGSLPTPCHQLRVAIGQPDAQNKLVVEVYSLSQPGRMCQQVLKGFEVTVPLGAMPASGHYTVSINGELMREFDY